MQPRTLAQVMTELDSVYNPQLDLVRQKQSAIPGQIQAEEAGLKAQEQDYYDNTIMSGARRRGLGFSLIPEGERARYGATQYLPALARLRQSGREQAMSLEEAILGINERRNDRGQSIYQNEQSMFEQRRQFDEQMRAQREQQAAASRAASSFAPSLGGGGGSGVPTQAAAPTTQGQYGFKNGKDGGQGFWFTDAAGRPVSAAKYAALNGLNAVQIFQKMASAGDNYAKLALAEVGNKPGFSTALRTKYKTLFN